MLITKAWRTRTGHMAPRPEHTAAEADLPDLLAGQARGVSMHGGGIAYFFGGGLM